MPSAARELVRLGRIPREADPRFRVKPGEPRSPMASERLLYFLESGGPAGKFSAVIPGWVANRTVVKEIR